MKEKILNYGCAATSFQPKRVGNRDAGTGVHDGGTGALHNSIMGKRAVK